MMHIVNERFILYVFPHECVIFQQLNDDFMGVGVERANARTPSDALSEVGSVTLVRWPIDQITMLDGRPLQRYVLLNGMQGEQGHVSNVDDDENVANVANVASSSRKRCYTFISRV